MALGSVDKHAMPLASSRWRLPLAVRIFERYQGWVGAGVILIFFSGLDHYLYSEWQVGVPLYWMAGAGAACLPILMFRWRRIVTRETGMLAFVLLYLIFAMTGFLNSSQSAIAEQVFQAMLLTVLFLSMSTVAFSSPRAIELGLYAVVYVVIVGAVFNFVDILLPGTLHMAAWRAEGIQSNPNAAAIALVLGMMASLSMVTPRWRGAFVWLVSVAVLLTLSRSGIIVLTLAIVIALYQRLIGWRTLVAAAVAAFGAFFVAIQLLSDVLPLPIDSIRNLVVDDRLSWVVYGEKDHSLVEREELVYAGIELFSNEFWLGAGVGATKEWAYPFSPHNAYLMFAAEHGIAGLLIIPAFGAALIHGATGAARKRALASVMILMVWSLFEYNVLDHPPLLAILALVAAGSALSRASPLSQRSLAIP